MALFPAVTVVPEGDAAREKSAKKIANATLEDCKPPVPVTVKFRGFAEFAVRPVTLRVLDPPTGTELGLKEHVTVLLQDKPTVPRYVLGPETEREKVALAVPMRTTLARWLEERVKTGFPVPDKLIIELEFDAFDAMPTLPVIFPELVGVKLTAMVHDWPTFNEAGTVGKLVPQVVVTPKFTVVEMFVMVTG